MLALAAVVMVAIVIFTRGANSNPQTTFELRVHLSSLRPTTTAFAKTPTVRVSGRSCPKGGTGQVLVRGRPRDPVRLLNLLVVCQAGSSVITGRIIVRGERVLGGRWQISGESIGKEFEALDRRMDSGLRGAVLPSAAGGPLALRARYSPSESRPRRG